MRKKIVAGNWKMNKTIPEAEVLLEEILLLINEKPEFKTQDILNIVFAPPFTFLSNCSKHLEAYKNIFTAAQNCHSDEKGAFTGEVSAAMIRSAGASYVIIGHSERRKYFNESHEFLARKTDTAMQNGLIPIFCVGETLEQRERGDFKSLIENQISESLFHLSAEEFKKVVIAYEPVWAIGTGLNATPQQAQDMHAFIRNLVKTKYSSEISVNSTILYGGSCNAQNADEIFAMPDVDGGLIGGASLKAGDFVSIIDSLLKSA